MNRLRSLPVFFLILTLLFQASSWAETNAIVLTDDTQMALGDAFLAEGDYYRAVTEYKKLTIFFPDSHRFPEALYKIGMAYIIGEEITGPLQKALPRSAKPMPRAISATPPFMRD